MDFLITLPELKMITTMAKTTPVNEYLDIHLIMEDETRADLMLMGKAMHGRLRRLQQRRVEGAPHPKLDSLIIEMIRRVADISRVYVSTDDRLAPAPLRLPPQDAPDQEWLIPRPNQPTGEGAAARRWGSTT